MPQLLAPLIPNATITLSPDSLSDKPELAAIVVNIFGLWAWIEHEVSMILVRVLGAHSKPALAMFSVLTSDAIQRKAMDAAAKVELPADQYQVFGAVMKVVESVGSDRHKLAHWIWGRCTERSDVLLLQDPKHFRVQATKREEHHGKGREYRKSPVTIDELRSMYGFDPAHILVYTKGDLERSYRDLGEASTMLFYFNCYLRGDQIPPLLGEDWWATRPGALRELRKLRLFREALDTIERAANSSPLPSGGSQPPKPNGS